MHEIKAWAQQGGGRKGAGNGEVDESGRATKAGTAFSRSSFVFARGKKNKPMKPNQKPWGKNSSEPQGAPWRVGGIGDMNGVTWSCFLCSRGRKISRSPAGPGASSQASKGWILSKWAPLGCRSGKGEGKQRELRALRSVEFVTLKMFNLSTVNDVNFWEHGNMSVCRGRGQGRAPKAPSPQGPEPRRMGMDTARGVGRQSRDLGPQGWE